MRKIILLTDFSESYANNLLKGIIRYSKGREPWVLCKMPLSFREVNGIEGVLDWACKWKADGIIAQFYNDDDVDIFRRNHIVAVAQDFKERFTNIPNITGDYRSQGRTVADYFLKKDFRNFAFYGFSGVVWSDERCEGFRERIAESSLKNTFSEYSNNDSRDLWFYESQPLAEWLDKLPKPAALMCCDDNQGSHLIEVCRQCNLRVPQDVAIMGVDNDDVLDCLCEPRLSSLKLDVEKGGYDTAAMIERMIEHPDAECGDIIVPQGPIITRRSSDIYATADRYISTVLQYIHNNCDKQISVTDLVNLVPMSRRLLENKFREVTGMAIYEYVINLKMEKFADRLLQTDDPISDIAMRIGFPDSKNVSRKFKLLKGCTPSEYRKREKIAYNQN
jgi:LacI family transcriptional regulator